MSQDFHRTSHQDLALALDSRHALPETWLLFLCHPLSHIPLILQAQADPVKLQKNR